MFHMFKLESIQVSVLKISKEKTKAPHKTGSRSSTSARDLGVQVLTPNISF